MREQDRRPADDSEEVEPGLASPFGLGPLAPHAARLAPHISRVRRWPPATVLLDTLRSLGEHRAGDLAAAIAFYGLFSLFPLFLGLIALLSLFLDPVAVEAQLVEVARRNLPDIEGVVVENVRSVVRLRGALGLASILGLLWSGSAVFATLARALDRAWGIEAAEPFYRTWARRLLLALGVGALLALSLSATVFVQLAEELAAVDQTTSQVLRFFLTRGGLGVGSVVTSLGVLALLYQFTTTTHIPWRDLWPGVLLAGALFELAKNAFVLYLSEFARFQQVYGSLSSVIALLLWAYVSALILIVGAEFGAAVGRQRRREI